MVWSPGTTFPRDSPRCSRGGRGGRGGRGAFFAHPAFRMNRGFAGGRALGGSSAHAPKPSTPPPVPSWREIKGDYVPATRHEPKDKLTRPFPPPTADYLASSELPSESLPMHVKQEPPIVALSPSHTVLERIDRATPGHRTPIVRTCLATFLEYVCGADQSTGKPRFLPVLFSPAQRHNVLAMAAAVDLISAAKLDLDPASKRVETSQYEFAYEHGDVLSKIVSREDFGLTKADFEADVPTVKNLIKALPGTSGDFISVAHVECEDGSFEETELPWSEIDDHRAAHDVVLIDEDKGASAQQPYNHLLISPFLLNESDYPTSVDRFVPLEQRTSSGHPALRRATLAPALELDEDHPLASDTALLGTIYLLERLRRETNISGALRSGLVAKIRDEVVADVRALEGREPQSEDVDAVLAEKGRKVCERLGIEVDSRWRGDWRSKMLEKEGRDVVDSLIAGAPYLCCAVIGCWLTSPMNKVLGRRGTIFWTVVISALSCIWQGCTNSRWHLFAARFVLGFGIGPTSATVPVFAAETAPPLIRGALVRQWQVWTAFGIMMGTVSSLAFYKVSDPSNITGLNWRLMLGSACLPAFFVMAQIYLCPESPRWLISKGRYRDAYTSLCRLRHSKLQAARDLFMINALLEEEANIATGKSAIVELLTVGRNRRATLASGIVMFMQQFCGINVIAYYSSTLTPWLDQTRLSDARGPAREGEAQV